MNILIKYRKNNSRGIGNTPSKNEAIAAANDVARQPPEHA
jgi:hypothetical protein